MQNKKIMFAVLATLVIAAGVFIRYWQLDNIPPGIQYDEAYNGINALQALETGDFKIFYSENFGREGFHLNVTALFIKLFGVHNFSLRLANALWGSLTVLGFFLLLRALKLSRLSCLMGTFMLAFSFWHLNFSRTAYRAIMVPMLITWLSYFFFEGINAKTDRKRFLYFSLSGLVTGLGFHTYIAFRVAPMIVVALVAALLLTKKDFIHAYWKSAMVYIFSAFLVMLPIIVYFANHRADLTSRTSAVSVFNAPGMTMPQALGKSFAVHIGSFFVMGDHNQRHNHNSQPTIPLAWSVLLVLGFAISAKEIGHTVLNLYRNWKKPEGETATALFFPSLLAQAIFWVMLIPGVLSIEGIPHSLRIIGAIPGVFLFTALPFEYVSNLYGRMKSSETLPLKPWRWNILRLSMAGLVTIVIITGIMQAGLYFNVWAKDQRTLGAFERKLFDLGLLVQQLTPKMNNYIITTESIHVSADHRHSSLITTEYLGYPNVKQYQFFHPLDGRFDIDCQDTQVLFQEADKWLIDQFKFRCPELKEEQVTPNGGVYPTWVLR